MTTIGIPGVYAAQQDTWLLGDVLDDVLSSEDEGADVRRVLELGTGSGALAVRAARHPATHVTAVDVSRWALLSARRAAGAGGVSLRLRRGDLTAPVAGERFDLVVSNPPYVPAPTATVPRRGPARAWDAGPDGRAVLDRLCRDVPRVLAPGGTVLVVQSEFSGIAATCAQLAEEGLDVDVPARCEHPFGPVMSSRVEYLEGVGIVPAGVRTETLAVVRGRG